MIKAIFISFILIINAIVLQGQFLKRTTNAFDKDGLRKGLWITYWDEDKSIPMSRIRFKNDRETGVSKEYHNNGTIRLKFRHGKNKMRVKYFDTKRSLEQKGWAVIEYNDADTHYYWHGKWKFYNEKRKIERVAMYENGEEVAVKLD